jgi:two-component system response regulator YesN
LERLLHVHDLSCLRVALGIGRQIDEDELDAAATHGRWDELCANLAALVQAFRTKNRLEFLASLDRAERSAQSLGGRDREEICRNVNRFIKTSVGSEPAGSLGDRMWLDELRALAQTLHGQEKAEADLVEQVVSFVRENYSRDIGIGRIAFNLGVTPNYLSTLFHKKTGITFVKYLTRLRLEKAQDLLATGRSLVQEVAREVGYASVRHFSRLFQKQFGAYPSEMQKQEKKTPPE